MRPAVAAGLVLVALVAPTLPAASLAADGDPVPLDGLVTIAPAPTTGTPDVTLHLAPPTATDGTVRISNDGAQWVTLPWAASVPWSLIHPTAGGADTDGVKTVWVDYGDGTDWHLRDTADTTLDRVAPELGEATLEIDGRLWRGTPTIDGFEPGDELRSSLDGTTW